MQTRTVRTLIALSMMFVGVGLFQCFQGREDDGLSLLVLGLLCSLVMMLSDVRIQPKAAAAQAIQSDSLPV